MDKLKKSTSKSLIIGMVTGGVNVGSLMWLRTVSNYQYRNATTMTDTIKILYNEGGIRRFYRGIGPALTMTCMCRISDLTTYYYLDQCDITRPERCAYFGISAGATRAILSPIETYGLFMQTQGLNGRRLLLDKINKSGYRVLYQGVLPIMTISFSGSFTWYMTFDSLNKYIKQHEWSNGIRKDLTNGIVGMISSMAFYISTNPLRSIKVYRQAAPTNMSYYESIPMMIREKGIVNAMFRGLKPILLQRSLQSGLYVIIWKRLEGVLHTS